MSHFQLHPRLQQDTVFIGSFELSQLLLMNDSLYPWFILVPQKADIGESYQLAPDERQQLQTESCLLAERLAKIYKADKMNVAALGNMVPQLHIHHVVRYKHDKAWPAPIWGAFDAVPYTEEAIEQQRQRICAAFPELTL